METNERKEITQKLVRVLQSVPHPGTPDSGRGWLALDNVEGKCLPADWRPYRRDRLQFGCSGISVFHLDPARENSTRILGVPYADCSVRELRKFYDLVYQELEQRYPFIGHDVRHLEQADEMAATFETPACQDYARQGYLDYLKGLYVNQGPFCGDQNEQKQVYYSAWLAGFETAKRYATRYAY